MNEHQQLAARQIRFGFWILTLFLALGMAIEVMLGFKLEMYMGVSNDTRRLMWTLAHAHGALLGLLHVVYGLTVYATPAEWTRRRTLVTRCLGAGVVLLPGGFFLGGFGVMDGDPGVGVFLAPVGAAAILAAVFWAALDASAGTRTADTTRERDTDSSEDA